MRIFRIIISGDDYQKILPSSKSDEIWDMLDFDGTPKEENWQPIEFYVSNPLKKKGNFFAMSDGGAFACDEIAVNKLSDFLGFESELLPIYLEDGAQLYIFNVTQCRNALDQKKSKFDYYEDGTKGRVLEHVFHKDRYGETSIFKIPETRKIHVLTFSGLRDPGEEFYTAYLKSGLTGLHFEELYRDDEHAST